MDRLKTVRLLLSSFLVVGLIAGVAGKADAACHLANLNFTSYECYGSCTNFCLCNICDPVVVK